MGIRGLLQYTKAQPSAYYEVDMRELSAIKRREGKEPVVILDGFVCGTYIYGDLDWMCGGQYKEYLDKLKQFMKSFEDAGIKLIIIMDGSCLKKQSVWVKRRYDMLHKSVYPVFDFLKNGKNLTARCRLQNS